jgi:hypothetical protein
MMDALNPDAYRNGELIEPAVAQGETVNSASEAITLGPAKAIVAAVGGALVGGLTALATALADDQAVSSSEWVAVALALIIGSGVVGGGVYATRTTVTGNRT